MTSAQGQLFQQPSKARYGDSRSHRNLFIPRLLRAGGADHNLMGEQQDRAYEIIKKWADLETQGKLRSKKETTLEGEFITDVFGEALGYTLLSKAKKQWDIEAKFSVNGGIADAVIGEFEHGGANSPHAIIELKGPTCNLDRDRSGGRTAVQQCWDYLNALPECPWGIVCNYVSFRLYHRQHTPRAYQQFALQDLRDLKVFREFYHLFERRGLLPGPQGQPPRAAVLLEKTGEQQKHVGDDLYNGYHENRVKLIRHLCGKPHNKSLDDSIHVAQKLLDRIIFVAFCEDRDLLPEKSLSKAYSHLPPFYRVTNPRWQNFLDLFRSMDKGNKERDISPFNGGLFRQDDDVDKLELEDEWTHFFNNVGKYDFRDEVNVDVLGHLFERSIRDIGRIRLGGLFGTEVQGPDEPKMSKSAERKRLGVYYTPPEFTNFITRNVVAKVVEQRFEVIAKEQGLDLSALTADKPDSTAAQYFRDCYEALRDVKVVDPACGSGAFLISAYDVLEEKYQEVIDHIEFHQGKGTSRLEEDIPNSILHENLFGVDLSPAAVEITQLALWIRSARKGKTLADLSRNIICGNSLITNKEVDSHAMTWEVAFSDVFSRKSPGFDCVIGNPPWERMKLQEREFFDATDSRIATAVNAATRRKLIANLKKSNPELHDRYFTAKKTAELSLDHIRKGGHYPLTGKGDINTYAVFAELAKRIVAPKGRVGVLVPSGIATDHTTKEFFGHLTESQSLIGLYDFENKAPVFQDLHRSFKFSVLLCGGDDTCASQADFVFFARSIQELHDQNRHIRLSRKDIKLLNPNTHTCPIFRSRRDAELTKAIYRRVPILLDRNRKEGGNPWRIRFLRMFDQTNDAELFHTTEQLTKMKFRREGNHWVKGKRCFLPLYEAKMIQMYDHRAASVEVKSENWMRQGQTLPTSLIQHQNPEYAVEPRWWVRDDAIAEILEKLQSPALLAFKDVTSATNRRTMISSFLPLVGTMNSAPLMGVDNGIPLELKSCLLANLNSFVLDYVARQKVGNVHLNFFLIEQFPMLAPDSYLTGCPWRTKQTLVEWISERVLKLSCTSNDMMPLAEATGFTPTVYKWKPDERADIMAQLDAAYFILYGVERDDVGYILSTFSGVQRQGEALFESADTKDLILRHYDHLLSKSGNTEA